MVGKSTAEFTLRKANQSVTLRSTVKIKGEPARLDPESGISETDNCYISL